jgi:hypothetical protein
LIICLKEQVGSLPICNNWFLIINKLSTYRLTKQNRYETQKISNPIKSLPIRIKFILPSIDFVL